MRGHAAVLTLLAAGVGCSFDASGLGGAGAVDARTGNAVDAALGADAHRQPPDAAPTLAPPCTSETTLIACYRFETGDAALEPHDEGPLGHDGSSTHATLIASMPGHGMALSFAPTTASLVGDSTTLDVQNLTVEMWLDVRTLPPHNGRAGLLDENGEYGLVLAPDGAVRCAIGSATDIGLAIPAATWTHVACTYDGSTIRLYQDGVAGPTLGSMGGVPSDPTDGLALGQNLPSGDHLDGAEDDVRIWAIARSPAQICADAGLPCT